MAPISGALAFTSRFGPVAVRAIASAVPIGTALIRKSVAVAPSRSARGQVKLNAFSYQSSSTSHVQVLRRAPWWRASLKERASSAFKLAFIMTLALPILQFMKQQTSWANGLGSTEVRILFALSSFIIAPITPLFAKWVNERVQNRQALAELRGLRQPMMVSIGNLLWRLDDKHGLLAFLGKAAGDEHMLGVEADSDEPESKRDYLIHDTVYHIALLFYWMRRMREELAGKGILGPFTKNIEAANDALAWAFSESHCLGGRTALESFAGQRDAIATLMEDDSKKQPIRYGEFRKRLQDGAFAHWLENLLKDVTMIVDHAFDSKSNKHANGNDCWLKASLERTENISSKIKILLSALASPADIVQMPWLKSTLVEDMV